jgi:aspartate/methionine/tyrosine aminotransferase
MRRESLRLEDGFVLDTIPISLEAVARASAYSLRAVFLASVWGLIGLQVRAAPAVSPADDGTYEYILYDGARHVSIATLPGMRERTITISGLSKTWSATGWRIGWCVAPADLTGAIRKVHDFLTVGAPAPLQEAAADALAFGPEHFARLAGEYRERRDLLVRALEETGFGVSVPKGAYYAMADISGLTDLDDVAFAMELVAGGGVATVPGSSFFLDPRDGRRILRFCFAKKLETIERAAAILRARIGRSR